MMRAIKEMAYALGLVSAGAIAIIGSIWGAVLAYWVFIDKSPVEILTAVSVPYEVEDGGVLVVKYTYRKTRICRSSNKDVIEIGDHILQPVAVPTSGVGELLSEGADFETIFFFIDLPKLPDDIAPGEAEYRRELTYYCNPVAPKVISATAHFRIVRRLGGEGDL